MSNSQILYFLIPISWILGILVVWFAYLFLKSTHTFAIKKTEAVIHLMLSLSAFVAGGAVLCVLAFFINPDEIRDCLGSVCKIVKTNRLENAKDFGTIFGLVIEFLVSLILSLKLFTKKLENFDSEPE